MKGQNKVSIDCYNQSVRYFERYLINLTLNKAFTEASKLLECTHENTTENTTMTPDAFAIVRTF